MTIEGKDPRDQECSDRDPRRRGISGTIGASPREEPNGGGHITAFKSNRTRRTVIVYVVAGLCLLWVVRGVRFDELLRQIRGVRMAWLVPAILLDIATSATHGVRWRLLLRPLGTVSLFRTVQSIYAGLFSNEILPFRAGELVRGYIMARELRLPFATVLPSMITERLFDGVLLLTGLAVSALFVTFPDAVSSAGAIFAIVLLGAIVLLAALAFAGGRAKRPAGDETPESGSGRIRPGWIARFGAGIRIIRTPKRFAAVLALSLLYLSLQALAYWLVMRAYGLAVAIWIPAVVLIVVRLGTSVPSAPANIGPYQFFCVLALTLFGIDKTTAAGVAFTLWILFSIVILLLGFIAFIRSGVNLSRITERA